MTVSLPKGPMWLSFFFCVSMTMAQDGLPPNYPEELLPPPEPLVTPCDCEYLATTQPSQGVLQDDPKDLNLLETKRGTVTLSSVLLGIQPPDAFRVPTQEALLPMVTNRTTFLLAANPYNRLPTIGTGSNQAFPNASENFTKLRIFGRTKFSQNVPVHVRASVYLNGNRVDQYLITKTPKAFPLAGSCDNTFRDINFEVDMLENFDSVNLDFKFGNPGDYVIRTELVYHDAFQPDISQLRPTGIAFDVYGKVVASKAPRIHFVPVVRNDINGASLNNYLFKARDLADGVKYFMREFMAIPSEAGPVTFQTTPIRPENFSSFNQLTKHLHQAARNAPLTLAADKIVAIVEDEVFDEWLYYHAPGTNFYTQNQSVAGIHGSGKIIIMRGLQRQSSISNPVKFILPLVGPDREPLILEHYMRYIVEGLTKPLWKQLRPEDDCAIPNYIGQLKTPAFGIRMRENRLNFTYAEAPDLMTRSANAFRKLCQCTYRHTFRALKKNKQAAPMVVVRGTAYRDSFFSYHAELDPSYRVEGDSELGPFGLGSWRIVFRNIFGFEIASYPFEPPFNDSDEFDKSAVFNFTLPAPPGLASIEVEGPSAIILGGPQRTTFDAFDVSPNPPKIQDLALNPLPGPDQLVWQASDNDGDPLLYTVLFSEDGNFYFPTGIFETQATQALLDIPFTVTHIKLVATDGANSDEWVIPRWNFP